MRGEAGNRGEAGAGQDPGDLVPRLVTFFIPLPEPLTLVSETTVAFEEDEPSAFPAEMPRWVKAGVPSHPRAPVDRNVVSLKVWQRASAMVVLQEQLRLTAELASTVTGTPRNADAAPTVRGRVDDRGGGDRAATWR